MAHAETLKTDGVFEALSQTFAVIGRALVSVSYAGHIEQEVKKLAALTDEELAERGTSRNAEIVRLFSAYN